MVSIKVKTWAEDIKIDLQRADEEQVHVIIEAKSETDSTTEIFEGFVNKKR